MGRAEVRRSLRQLLGIGALVAGTVVGIGAQGVPPAAAATTSLTAANAGFFDATGFHPHVTTNYFTGGTGNPDFHGGRLRSFFVFDTTALSGHVVSAVLSAKSYGGTGAPDTLTLHDVSTPPATLAAEGNGATQVFDDLGTGTVLGSVAVPDPTAPTITVPLSSAGVSALQSALGGTFALGGDYAPGATSQQSIFELTGGESGQQNGHPLSDVQLLVTTEPSPTTTTSPAAAPVVDRGTANASTTITTVRTAAAAAAAATATTTTTTTTTGSPLAATGSTSAAGVALGALMIALGSLLVVRRPASARSRS